MELEFSAQLWLWDGPGAWYFVTVPHEYYSDLKEISLNNKRGFGSLKVQVISGISEWETSIFPDNDSKTFLLPVKKQVRQKNKVDVGDEMHIKLKLNALA